MAYSTGSASNFSDLLTALVSACTAAGWSWDATSGVLSKGAVFVKMAPAATNTDALVIQGGLGLSAGALVTPCATTAQMYRACQNPITWPVTYHVLIGTSPDSVVLLINHNITYWQWMVFGQAINLGAPGSGVYFGASVRSGIYTTPAISVNVQSNAGTGYNQHHFAIPFWSPDAAVGSFYQNCFIDVNLEGCEWGNDAALNGQAVRADWPAITLMATQPNAWNADAMLLPLRIYGARPSSLYSALAQLPNVRLVRNTNYSDGDIITLGSDRWKVFPGRCKNTSQPDGAQNMDHSGTYALAVLYDGP